MKGTLLILTIILSVGLKAQDQIYKKDHTRLTVKILEVGTEEIKYKLFDNLTGPTYIESKKNVDVIVYQNGQHEVITSPAPSVQIIEPGYTAQPRSQHLDKKDSLIYYRYNHNISINFLNFFNNEIGLIYQREFFNSNFNIIIPLAFGLSTPGVTQDVYFTGTSNNGYALTQKLYEVGFGINYYPSLRTNVNYFIGPVFRYQKYDGVQTYYTYGPPQTSSGYVSEKNTTLSRYCMSITNGFVIRTRSRLTATLFGSIGFKNDIIDDPMTDKNGASIMSINKPLSLYFWGGFNVGFNF